MPFTLNGIGTAVYRARGYMNWGQESFDAVEWFVILFVPIIPVKTVHTYAWNGSAYRQIPIRPTRALIFASVCHWFARVALFLGAILGIVSVVLLIYCLGAGLKWRVFLEGAIIMATLGGVGGLVYWGLQSCDQRHRAIRFVIGPHQLGSSDPFTWTEELLYTVRDPKVMYGTASFESAVQPLLNDGQYSRAMWAARLSAALEDEVGGEALTDSVLGDFRVQQAIERVIENRNCWPEVMTKRDGTTGPPQAAYPSNFEEIPDVLPAD